MASTIFSSANSKGTQLDDYSLYVGRVTVTSVGKLNGDWSILC